MRGYRVNTDQIIRLDNFREPFDHEIVSNLLDISVRLDKLKKTPYYLHLSWSRHRWNGTRIIYRAHGYE